MLRRGLLTGAAALGLARPGLAQPANARVIRFIPQAGLASLDPIWTTATVTRNHGYLVFDTLYGMGADFRPTPQMAAGMRVEDDGRRVTVTLRAGPRFHDGTPVLARDCVASLRRWMRRSPIGGKLSAVLDELSADGDRDVVFRLRRPFPMLAAALGTVASPAAVIMPERLAATDPFQQVREIVGSGPYRFRADEYDAGSLATYERFAGYSPTEAPSAGLTAGPKLARMERVEWHVVADASTAAAAMQNGEMDWYEQPNPEIQELLRRGRTAATVSVEKLDPRPLVAILRFNHLHPPFDDPAVRRAVLPAVSQEDFMVASVGTDPGLREPLSGVFTPGTPLATLAGLEALRGPRDLALARRLLREAGYSGAPMRLIGPTDILVPTALTQVAADLFPRIGFNQDLALADWGTVVQRRTSQEPVERGGWSALLTSFTSFEFADPAGHYPLRCNGLGAWPGWPTVPAIEALRDRWFETPDLEGQRAIAAEMQRVAMHELPFVPAGAYYSATAIRRDLVDRQPGLPVFWGIRRA